MNAEPDAAKRMAMAEEYFDHVFEEMLQPCVIENPCHPVYNPKLIAEWNMHPSLNGNLSGANSFETVVLKQRATPAEGGLHRDRGAGLFLLAAFLGGLPTRLRRAVLNRIDMISFLSH